MVEIGEHMMMRHWVEKLKNSEENTVTDDNTGLKLIMN